MSTIALNQTAGGRTPISAWMTPWQAWGLILVVPYLLVFVLFVLYPIGYGFWVARHPQTYVHLFEDPIFARSVVNTLVFLIVAINLKMIVALPVHPAVGGAVDPDNHVAAVHAQP
jgi:multiple sugar transport system permease protein